MATIPNLSGLKLDFDLIHSTGPSQDRGKGSAPQGISGSA